jgi:hypothetical protein
VFQAWNIREGRVQQPVKEGKHNDTSGGRGMIWHNTGTTTDTERPARSPFFADRE